MTKVTHPLTWGSPTTPADRLRFAIQSPQTALATLPPALRSHIDVDPDTRCWVWLGSVNRNENARRASRRRNNPVNRIDLGNIRQFR